MKAITRAWQVFAFLSFGVPLVAAEEGTIVSPPLVLKSGVFDQAESKTLGLAPIAGRHQILYRASQDGYKFCHHANVGIFKGRLYVAWSNGIEHEDENGQRVLYCHTDDGVEWTRPTVLARDPDGPVGEMGCVAAGFHTFGDTLVAYYTAIVHKHPVHEKNTLYALTSTDGKSWGRPRKLAAGFFIESPRRLRSGRLLMNGEWANRQPRILYSDARDGVSEWKDAAIPPAEVFAFPEPSWFQRPDESIVMVFRVRSQNADGRLFASVSVDDGKTWTRPTKTDFPDATARTCAGNLADGTAYIINNPSHTPAIVKSIGRRSPLTIALSSDCVTFDRAFIVRGEETTMRFPGTHKLSGWQYPAAIVWKDHLYVVYSINKEDVGVTRIALRNLLP